MNLYCNGCLDFNENISLRKKRNKYEIDLLTICQFHKSYNSIMLEKLKLVRTSSTSAN